MSESRRNGSSAGTPSGPTAGRLSEVPKQKYERDEFTSRAADRPRGGGGGGGIRMGGGGMGGGMGGGGGRIGGHGNPEDKVKDFKKTLLQTIRYMNPFKWLLASIIILSCISSIITIWTPLISSRIIDNLNQVAHGIYDSTDLLRWVVLLATVSLTSALFGLFQQRISANITQKIVYSFRRDLEQKLSRLPLKFFDGRTQGEILSRVVYDVDSVGRMLQSSITQVITSTITVVGVLLMMLRLNPLLTLITMSITPLYLLVVYVIAPRSQRYFVGQSRSLGDLNGHIEEMYGGQKIVKLFSYEQHSIAEFEEINERYYQYSRKAQFISGMINPLVVFLGNFGYVLVCVVGGMFMTGGTLTLGTISAFMQYVRQFNMPLAQISHIAEHIQSVLAASERIFAILQEEEEAPEAVEPVKVSDPLGAVCFEHVEFGYSADRILMEDLNITVSPGQTVAIVGPTGAGKTTLVNLLMRFYDVGKGRITVDGVDIREMTRRDLRSMLGMVLQDTWLYNATIRDNIRYGAPEASEEQIVAASVAARSNHFIRTLQDGYDTVINENATNISQGQKQLITIARAFLADPAILILDEATSNVDTRTEILIQNAMAQLMHGRTSFVIAHRLSTIRNADIILVMNQGAIIESGTHDSLMADRGFYYEMYNSQFNREEEIATESIAVS
ncbi:MAG: ABC transporter ATP-binding protein/permease [Symbiobacteriaceae bacterium]|nr:ABC transporter ATP-binding protein/permease [Symbiobacteriaceae bacterium]